jgi:hypothetical protein
VAAPLLPPYARLGSFDLESSGRAMDDELPAAPPADEPPAPSCGCVGMRGLGEAAAMGKTRGCAAMESSGDWAGRGDGDWGREEAADWGVVLFRSRFSRDAKRWLPK